VLEEALRLWGIGWQRTRMIRRGSGVPFDEVVPVGVAICAEKFEQVLRATLDQ